MRIVVTDAPWSAQPGAPAAQNADAFRRALAALAAASGGILEVPAGAYDLGGVLDVGGYAPVTVRGEGWRAWGLYPPGDPRWAGALSGTVLAGGLRLAGPSGRGLGVEGLALLGAGSGVGLDLSGCSFCRVRDVFAAGFATGFRLSGGVLDCELEPHAWGCGTGILIDGSGAVDDVRFPYLSAQGCTVGLALYGGTLVRVQGGLLQANATGLLIAPAAYSPTGLSFGGLWFEANTVAHVVLDTTLQPLACVAFRDGHAGSYQGSTVPVTFAGTHVVNGLTIENCDWYAVDLAVPANVLNFMHAGSRFRSLTDGSRQG